MRGVWSNRAAPWRVASARPYLASCRQAHRRACGRFSSRRPFRAINASRSEPGGILSMAERPMTWKERPVDFVSTLSATTVNGLSIATAFGLGDDHTEVIAALGTGSGEVYNHLINLALPSRPFKRRSSVVGRPFPHPCFSHGD
jgi:hypothetical protein